MSPIYRSRASLRGPVAWLGTSALALALAGAAHAAVLTPVPGSPLATRASSEWLTFGPHGLIASASYSNAVSLFSIGSHDSLDEIAESPFSTGPVRPVSVALSPDGKWLATANETNGVATTCVFSVGAGGALTPVAGSPYAVGRYASAVSFSSDGKLLAVANAYADTVSVFDVSATGSLTKARGSPFPTLNTAIGVAFSPVGKVLAVTDYSAPDGLSLFAVDSSGALNRTADVRLSGDSPVAVAFSPDGRLVATANSYGASVSVFRVKGDDSLREVTGSPISTNPPTSNGGPFSVSFSGNGRLLAAGNAGSVALFSIGAAGSIARVPGSPFSGPIGAQVAFAPRGRLLAVADYQSVSVFSVRAPSVDNHFSLLRIRAGPDGTVTVDARVPAPGWIAVRVAVRRSLARQGVVALARRHASRPGVIRLLARPSRRTVAALLRHTRSVPLRSRVAYTPDGGFGRVIRRDLQLRCVDPDHDADCDAV